MPSKDGDVTLGGVPGARAWGLGLGLGPGARAWGLGSCTLAPAPYPSGYVILGWLLSPFAPASLAVNTVTPKLRTGPEFRVRDFTPSNGDNQIQGLKPNKKYRTFKG